MKEGAEGHAGEPQQPTPGRVPHYELYDNKDSFTVPPTHPLSHIAYDVAPVKLPSGDVSSRPVLLSQPSTPVHERGYPGPGERLSHAQAAAMHSPAPSSPAAHAPVDAYGGSPMLQNQLMQMQSQLSMMSQLALANTHQASPSPAAAQRDSMLCFTLGERIGALHKHEEATKEGLSALKKGMEDNIKDIYDMRSKVAIVESELTQEQRSAKAIRQHCQALDSTSQEHSQVISRLEGDIQHEKSAAKTFKQAVESKIADLAKTGRSCAASITDIGKQLIQVENTNKHTTADQAELKERLQALRDQCQGICERMQAVELHWARDREQQKKRSKEVDETLRVNREEAQKQLRSLERHMQDLVQQNSDHLQQQLQALRQDLSSLSPTIHQLLASGAASQGMAGPVTMFALQALLPFLSSERLAGIGSWLASVYRKDWKLLPHLRSIWCVVLLCDLGVRVVDWYFPWFSGILGPALKLNVLSGNTLLVLRILRVFFEVGMMAQLLLSIYEFWQRFLANLKERVRAHAKSAKRYAVTTAKVTAYCSVPTVMITAGLLYYYKDTVTAQAALGPLRATQPLVGLYARRTARMGMKPVRFVSSSVSNYLA